MARKRWSDDPIEFLGSGMLCSAICDKNNAESGDKKLFTTK